MMNQTILEVVRQYWRSEDSHQPFRQPLGFSWELRDDGLYAWQVKKDTDETTVYTRHTFRMDRGRLQAMLKFIADTRHVTSDDEALHVLLAHLRSREGQPGCGRYLFLLLLPLLSMFCCLGIMMTKSTPICEFNIGLSALMGFLIAMPIIAIAYLLLFNEGRARSKAVRRLTYQDPEQYHQALLDLNAQLKAITMKPLTGVNWLLIGLLSLWLIVAIVITIFL